MHAALNDADHELTTHGTKLEEEQRAKAHRIDSSLHRDLAALKNAEQAYIARTKKGVADAIADRWSF